MADDKIIQQIELQGGKEVERQLEDIGKTGEQAFNDLSKAADQADLQKVADQAGAAASALDDTAQSADRAAKSLNQVGTAQLSLGAVAQTVKNLIIGVTAATASVVALGTAMFAAARSASTLALEIGRAAEAAGIASDKYQALKFMLEGIGLTSSQAEAAIKKMGEETSSELTTGGKAVLEFHKQWDNGRQVFAKTADGMDALRSSIAHAATQAAKGAVDIQKLRDAFETFRGATSDEDMRRFANAVSEAVGEMRKFGETGLGRARIFEVIGGGARDATSGAMDLIGSIAKLQSEFSTKNLLNFIYQLKQLKTEEEQVAVATSALGSEAIARDLVASLKSGNTQSEEFNRVLSLVQTRLQDAGKTASQAVAELDGFAAGFTRVANGAGIFIRTKPVVDDNTKALQAMDEALKTVNEDLSGENLVAFVSKLAQVRDGSRQSAAAVKLFEDEALGRDLIQALREATTEGEAFKRVMVGLKDLGADADDLKAFRDEFPRLAADFNKTAQAAGNVKTAAAAVVPPLQQVREAAQKLRDNESPENLVAFGAALLKVEDASKRLALAQAVLGEAAGRRLVAELNRSGTALAEQHERYKQLRIGVTDAQSVIADDFNRALTEMGVVARQNKIDLGLLFAPGLTALIREFNTQMRASDGFLVSLGRSISSIATPALEDFLKVLRGAKAADTPFKTSWVPALIDAFKTVKDAAVDLFNNVLLPAGEAVIGVIEKIIQKFNELFGTKLTLADFGFGVILASLLGGFNALALLIGSVFLSGTESMKKFRESLKGFGIDIEAISKILKDTLLKTWEEVQRVFSERSAAGDLKWIDTLKAVLASLPAQIAGVVAALLLLTRGFSGVAAVVSRVFGLEIKAAGALFVAVIGQMSGILPALSTALVATAAASTVLLNSLLLLNALFGPIGVIVALAAALVLLEQKFGVVSSAAAAFAAKLNELLGTTLRGSDVILGFITALGAALLLLQIRAAPILVTMTLLSAAIILLMGGWEALSNLIDNYTKSMAASREESSKVKEVTTGIGDQLRQLAKEFGIDLPQAVSSGAKETVSGLTKIRNGVWGVSDAMLKTRRLVQQNDPLGLIGTTVADLKAAEFEVKRLGGNVIEVIKKVDDATKEAGKTSARSPMAQFWVDLGRIIGITEQEIDDFNRTLHEKGLAEAILQDLGKSSAAIEKWFGDLFNDLLNTLVRFVATIPDRLISAMAAFPDQLVALFNRGIDLIQARLEQLAKWVTSLLPTQQPEGGIGGPIQPGEPGFAPVPFMGGRDAPNNQLAIDAGINDIGGGAGSDQRTKLEEIKKLVQEIQEAVVSLFAKIESALPELVSKVSEGLLQLLEVARGQFEAFGQQAFEAFGQLVNTITQQTTAAVEATGQGLTQLIATTFSSLQAQIEQAAASVNAAIQTIIAALEAAVQRAQALAAAAQAAAAAAASAGGGGGGDGFAGGGMIRGTPGIDKIPIWASDREYMINAKAVRYWGSNVLNAINSMRMPKFNTGGLISGFTGLMPSISGSARVPGAAAGPQHRVNMDFGGGVVFDVTATPDVADELQRFSVLRRMRSVGRRPRSGGA